MSGSGCSQRWAATRAAADTAAASSEYKDLIKAGIIDPAKVTRSALQNAASIAALFLTTAVVIADSPKAARQAPDPTWVACTSDPEGRNQ